MLSFALRVLVREGVKSKLLFRSSSFPERRKERLARKPSISNQSNLPVIIRDQHQITPARHDPSSLRCNGPLYGCVYTGGGRGEEGAEKGEGKRAWICALGGGQHPPEWESPPPSALGAARASGAESSWAGAKRGAWPSAPPPPPADISLPSPLCSSWASLTGGKLIINRVKLIKGLGARWGRSESSSPSSRPRCIRLPAGSGRERGLAAADAGKLQGSPALEEGRKRAARTGEGEESSGCSNKPRWVADCNQDRPRYQQRLLQARTGSEAGSAQLGGCMCTKPGPESCPRAVLRTQGQPFLPLPSPPPPPPLSPTAIGLCHGGSGETHGTRPGQRKPQPPAPRSRGRGSPG
ncbi:uncharacterized protein AAGF69_000736 isoform 2-T2 [Amazona ochrocephala]